MRYLLELIFLLLQGMRVFLVLGTLLPMILPEDNVLRDGITRIIEPVLRPFRKIFMPVSGFDFTPVVLFLFLLGIESLIRRFVVPLVVS